MKKVFKILGILMVITVIASVIMGKIADKKDGPRQSVKLINTSEETRSVTFNRMSENGDSVAAVSADELIKPNEFKIVRIPEGKYKIKVWNSKELLIEAVDFEFKLKDPNKSDYNLYRFDLALDKNFVVVNLNAVYGGNAFAEHMSKAVGTKSNRLKIEKAYGGKAPFLIPETFTLKTFVDMEDKLPKEVKYGEVVYGLYAFSNKLSPAEVNSLLYESVAAKIGN